MDMEQIGLAVTRQTEQIKTLFGRMDNLEKLTESVNKLALALERMTARQETVEKKVDEMRGDVDDIKEKPAKRWELVVGAVISALVGAGIALLIK